MSAGAHPIPSLRAKRSNPSCRAKKEWIASSRSLSSGARSRDPLASRNDGGQRNTGGSIMRNDLAELTSLNRDYVNCVQHSDVKRFDEILAEDFYCSNPDKSLVDRASFLKQTAVPVTIKNLEAHDVKIRVMGGPRHHPRRHKLHHAGRKARLRPLHRLLG